MFGRKKNDAFEKDVTAMSTALKISADHQMKDIDKFNLYKKFFTEIADVINETGKMYKIHHLGDPFMLSAFNLDAENRVDIALKSVENQFGAFEKLKQEVKLINHLTMHISIHLATAVVDVEEDRVELWGHGINTLARMNQLALEENKALIVSEKVALSSEKYKFRNIFMPLKFIDRTVEIYELKEDV